MKLLIDADYLVYATAAGHQQVCRWEDEIVTVHTDLTAAMNGIDAWVADTVSQIADELGISPHNISVGMAFSCPSRHYFRHDLYPDYKSNRKGTTPPLGLRELREYAGRGWESWTRPNLEADDVLGILATRDYRGSCVIVSVDKDLRQVPGLHFNPGDPTEGLVEITAADGLQLLYRQTLTGDAVDGYPGCPGVGPVTASRVLSGASNPWLAIVAAYQKAGLTEQEAVTQLNVARILTADAYDFKKKAPILWTP